MSMSACGAVGACVRSFEATSWIRQNRYWHHGMTWLATESYLEQLLPGLVLGAAAGALLAVPLALLLRRPVSPAIFRVVAGPGLLVAVLVFGLAVFHGVARPRPPAGSPSILLLTVDTQRADHLGCYDYTRNTSPELDRLAENGRIFSRAYSHAPATSSSVASLMSGLPPRETGSFGQEPVPFEVNTLAEYLKNAGYRTGAVISNPVLRKQFDQGFDHFDDRMDQRELIRRTPERAGGPTTEAALGWLQKNAWRPVFFWVHYMDPHGPYSAPHEYRRLFTGLESPDGPLELSGSNSGNGGIPKYQVLGSHRDRGYYVAQYDAEIRYFDASLADLIDGIRSLGLWDDALAILTSDHGEGMGEQDYYFAHGEHLYPSQLHVPLIVWAGARRGETAGREEAVVQHADLLPTVLSFCGIRSPDNLPGRDLFGGAPGDVEVLAENVIEGEYQCSLIDGNHQVYFDGLTGALEYYDLRDPATRVNECDPGFEEFADLTARVVERCAGFAPPGASPMDPEQIETLRSLGYLD